MFTILFGIDFSAASKMVSEIICTLMLGSVSLTWFAKSCSIKSCRYLPKSAVFVIPYHPFIWFDFRSNKLKYDENGTVVSDEVWKKGISYTAG